MSILLVGIGLIIRLRILETPAFAKLKEDRREVRQPIVEVLRHYPKHVLLASACDAVAIPPYGALSDRVGRRPV